VLNILKIIPSSTFILLHLEAKKKGSLTKALYKAVGEDELIIAVDYSLFGFTIFGITSSGIEIAQLRYKSGVETRKPVIYVMMHLAAYAKDRASNSRARVEGYMKRYQMN
jgi:hypothetical protein